MNSMQKILSQILPSIDGELIACDCITPVDREFVDNLPISSLVFDSREVSDGCLYFALPGTHTHGNNFIPQAIEKGANAIVFEGVLSKEIQTLSANAIIKRQLENAVSKDGDASQFAGPAFIKVKDARFSMAPLSASFFDNPSKRLVVIGVTGTEGKSSTVSFIWQLLRACGKKCGFISTVEYSFGGEALPNPQHQTTPEAPIIQSYLAKMLENGCQYAVIEASSHGLSTKLNRLGNILFDTAVFMNVTLEHLEFHKTFEQYRSDKANLFRALDKHDHVKCIAGESVKVPSIGVVNMEDASAEYFIKSTKQNIYGFTSDGMAGKGGYVFDDAPKQDSVSISESFQNTSGTVRLMKAKDIVSAKDGISFSVSADGKNAAFENEISFPHRLECCSFSVNAHLPGAFNVYNSMASLIAVSSVTGISFDSLAEKMPLLTPIKGRMTAIDKGQPFEVIVDYAHTPSSFETIFPPIKKRCSGKIFALFGSGGERDLTKRPLQGKIAARFCDEIFLTDEDPRGEDPYTLLSQIAEGAIQGGMKVNENVFIIPDRKKAIREAFKRTGEGDIVLLLGKSHENSIIYADYTMPYNEIEEAELALSEIGYKK